MEISVNLKAGNRVYFITTSIGKQQFCQLHQMNDIIKEMRVVAGYFDIYYFWNGKQKKVSKKMLKDFFEGSQLVQDFNY